MKLKYFASAIMAMALAGCSNEDVLVDDNQQGIQEGEKTYLSIAIDANNAISSRGTNGGMDEADLTAEEGRISTVSLFFFDKDGNPVYPNTSDNGDTEAGLITQTNQAGFYQASSLFGWESTSGGTGTSNIETKGNAVVSFMNLEGRNTPTQVLVVLNLTNSKFTELNGQNLNTVYGKLYESDKDAEEPNGTEKYYSTIESAKHFIMSNSVYVNNNSNKITATQISAANFGTTAIDARSKAVEVYVERLAGKVNVAYGEGITQTSGSVAELTTVGENASTEVTYAIKVTGWGLNAQNMSIYLFKQLDDSWLTTAPWATWNNPTFYRSYWAKDNNYESGSYPTSYNELYTSLEQEEEVNKDLKSDLKYYSYNELIAMHNTISANEVSYCNENTLNTEEDETVAATSVLVCAELGTLNGNDFTASGDLFYYGGQLLDFNNYKAAAASAMGAEYTSYWVKDESVDKKVRNIAPTDFVDPLTDLYDGYVSFDINDALTILKPDSENREPGTTNYVETTATSDELTEDLNTITKANGYKGGKMYYSIPIEHLNWGTENGEYISKGDGDYGVVRNHYYKVTITSIANRGKGVWNPEERIVPNTDITKYFLASRINVLSWHVVNQDAEL